MAVPGFCFSDGQKLLIFVLCLFFCSVYNTPGPFFASSYGCPRALHHFFLSLSIVALTTLGLLQCLIWSDHFLPNEYWHLFSLLFVIFGFCARQCWYHPSAGVASRDIWKWYSEATAFGSCAGQKIRMYVMLWGSIADAGTERAEMFMKVHLRFACKHSQEARRSSQHHF